MMLKCEEILKQILTKYIVLVFCLHLAGAFLMLIVLRIGIYTCEAQYRYGLFPPCSHHPLNTSTPAQVYLSCTLLPKRT